MHVESEIYSLAQGEVHSIAENKSKRLMNASIISTIRFSRLKMEIFELRMPIVSRRRSVGLQLVLFAGPAPHLYAAFDTYREIEQILLDLQLFRLLTK